MAFSILQLNGPWWSFNSGTGQGIVNYPGGLQLPESSFIATIYGLDEATTYYAVTLHITGFVAGQAGRYVTTGNSPASAIGPAVGTPSWAVGEGQQTRDFVVSLSSPMTGAQLNGAIFQVNLRLAGGVSASGDIFVVQSITTGEPRLNLSGSTNPSDGGQTPPEPINLNLQPAGTSSVIQGSQQILNANAVSTEGVFFGNTSFQMTVITVGLGTFAENGLTFLTKQNPFNSPAIDPVPFNIAPGFTGYGQIRCENNNAANSPQFWTFFVSAPVVASGGDFLHGMLAVECF